MQEYIPFYTLINAWKTTGLKSKFCTYLVQTKSVLGETLFTPGIEEKWLVAAILTPENFGTVFWESIKWDYLSLDSGWAALDPMALIFFWKICNSMHYSTYRWLTEPIHRRVDLLNSPTWNESRKRRPRFLLPLELAPSYSNNISKTLPSFLLSSIIFSILFYYLFSNILLSSPLSSIIFSFIFYYTFYFFYYLFYFLLSSSAGTASPPSLLVFLPCVEAGVFDYTSYSRVVKQIKMIAQKLDLFYLFWFHIVASHWQYRLLISY